MRKRTTFSLIAVLAILVGLGTSAWATVRNVPVPYATIQAAIDAADPGDIVIVAAGTYTENFDVNKHVQIIGAGSGDNPATNTVITQNPAGSGDSQIGVVQLSASGLSTANPILLQDLRLEPVGMAGISVGRFTQATGQTVEYVKLNNVHVVGTNVNPSTEQERGLYVDLTSTLLYLEVVNCAFDTLTYGWYFHKQVSADTSNVRYVTVENTTFNHNNHKGVYAEKLSDATFTGCTADQNGYDSSVLPSYFRPWSCGVDVNLKAGTYANLIFDDCVITNNAHDQAKEGVGLTVKARDDAPSYSTYPASVSNVNVLNCTISNNERGLRFGEPAKNNATPTNVTVYHNTFCNNTQNYGGGDGPGSAYGDLIDMTSAAALIDAENNYWCTVDMAQIAAKIYGDVDWSPWCNSDFSVCTYTWPVHNLTQSLDYMAIQPAINAANPGDYIQVDPGIFYEHDIIVNKSITLNGDPGDATPGPGANAPIVDGQNLYRDCFKIANGVSNVTIRGFEIRNYTAGTGNGEGNAVQAWVASTNNITIADNYMHDLRWNGVLVGNDGAIGTHTNWTLARNVLNNYGTGTFNRSGYGLELTNTSNGLIEDNIITAGTRKPGTGILVTARRQGLVSMTVRRNEVSGEMDYAGIAVYAYDIDVSNPSLAGVTIQNNKVDISGTAYAGAFVWNVGTGAVTNVTVFENSFIKSEGYGFRNWTAETVNASGNWWGVNTPEGVPTKKTGSVDYTPWLHSGTDMSGDPGFQGDFSTLWVDDNSPQTGSVGRVQEGVNMAVGSTVYLAAGTYEEQVHITTTGLNLIGAGRDLTTIQSPTSLPLYFTTIAQNHPIVFVDGATGVSISNLTVDGLGRGNGNYRFVGIAYWNSGGFLSGLHVTNIKETPFNGNQHGICVYAYNNTSGPYTLNISDVDADNYQKNGFALNGNGNLTVTLNDVTATGIGATTITAQNGIQIWRGTGTLTNCATTDNAWIWTSGTRYSAAGYLFWQSAVNASGCTSVGNQIGMDYDDASGSVSGGSVIGYNTTPDYSAGLLVANWNAAASGSHPRTRPLEDPVSVSKGSALDDPGDETVSISNVTLTGAGATASYGVDAYNAAGDMSVSVSGCTITNWENGVSVYRNGGTISTASITGCKLVNTNNAWDNVSGHTWNANCYSDFASNPGHPTQYNVPGGGGNVDLNPNPNGCSNVDIVITDPDLGCSGVCADGYFYLTLDQAGLLNLEVIVQLPTGISLNLGGNPNVMPPPPVDPNLQFAQAQAWGTNQVKINFMWDQTLGGSSGNPALYIARIPISALGAATGTYTVAGVSSLWFEIGGTPHADELMLGANDFFVDCTVPPAPATFVNNGTCAYGPGYTPANTFAITGLTSGGGSALASAWITFNGNASPTFALTLSGTDPYSLTFPAPADVATFYGMLDDFEGCNTLNLHVKDVECNESAFDLNNVGWDATAPSISGVPVAPTTIYGPSTYLQLDDDLTVLPDLNTGQACRATSGMLKIWYDSDPDTFFLPLPLTNEWPFDDTEAGAFWTWITTLSGVPNTANGEPYVFNVKACDCAGNCYASTMTLKIDISKPANVVTGFDARPAHLGVWLKWSWTAGLDAQRMEVWRSVIDAGEYPNYPNAKWNNPANYPVSYGVSGPAGYELVCAQTALTGTITSADLTANNQRGDFHQHVSGSYTYWLDARSGWVDGDMNASTYRDIYRYVTFVQDAGGNWSEVSSYTMGTNADRSTNYWLGDFATADAGGDPGSRGYVDTDDLGILSAFYFSAANNYCNIGPVKTPVENGSMGKSIPWPHGPGGGTAIDFYDLVPFSFNFGAVSPVTGGLGEFVVDLPPVENRLFGRMDALPVINLVRVGEQPLEVGQTFTVLVTLSGNVHEVVKAAEAEITYSEASLELVSAEAINVAVTDGILFNKVSPIAERSNVIGVAAAALGQSAALATDGSLAVLTFRWKSEEAISAEIRIASMKLADGSGATYESEGSALHLRIRETLPTEYALYQNYPNPFNPTTTIAFDLKESGFVRLNVFNLLGQEVATVVNRTMEVGHHTVTFDAATLPSGMYVYRIEVNGFTAQNKLLLMR